MDKRGRSQGATGESIIQRDFEADKKVSEKVNPVRKVGFCHRLQKELTLSIHRIPGIKAWAFLMG
jgi:hypothetical protein